MKKRLLSLALALSLCMGLCAPALAADVSGLDAKGAKAYYDVLHTQSDVTYADVKDLDGDKAPELITVDNDLSVRVWQIKNGVAAQTAEADAGISSDASVQYVSRDGKTYIYAQNFSAHSGFVYEYHYYIAKDGPAEILTYSADNSLNGTGKEEYT